MPEPTPKIFISYAWKNQAIAKRLQSDLKRDGVEVFVDYERITGGQSLPRRINEGLEWCDTLLLLWSADSAQSDWVSLEWENALQLKKRIIPCMLDATELPAVMRRLLYLNFVPYETGYAQLCRSLGVEPKVIARPVVPPEMPVSKLPPQHAEMPAPLLPAEKRETPPVPPKRKSLTDTFRRKPKPPDPAPVLKPPEVFDDTNATEMATPARWSRRKTLVTLILVAVISLMGMKVCEYVSEPRSKPAQSDSTAIRQKESPVVPPQSAKPESTAKKQTQPTNTERIKSNKPASPSGRTSTAQRVWRLRDKPAALSYADVKAMLQRCDFFCKENDWNKEFSNPQGRGFANQFEKSPDGKVIFDRASVLTWQQSGSDKSMTFAEAEKYVADLNAQNFAGHKDWRLPTLEEAMSLMEPTEPDGDLYIDLRFDRKQRWIWTADNYSAGLAWVASFNYGNCRRTRVTDGIFVRVVR